MARIHLLRTVLWATCLMPLILLGPEGSFGTSVLPSSSTTGVLTRVVSVKAETSATETTVTIKGNGVILEYEEQAFPEPPRIVVDLLCSSEGFETEAVPLVSPILERARIGRHPDRIRIVLDVKGGPIPAFSLRNEKSALHITVSHRTAHKEDEAASRVLSQSDESAPAFPEASPGGEPSVLPAPATPIAREGESPEAKGAEATTIQPADHINGEGRADARLFQEGMSAFQEENWTKAVESFMAIREQHSQGRYDERASFLLAKSYERLMEADVATHYTDIRNHYESFLSRFPSSEHGGDALVAIAHLSFRIGHYAEAMGYYGLAFSRDASAPAAVEALAGQMKIHMLKGRFDEALSLSGYILEHYPRSPLAGDVKMDEARIFFDLNRFQESLTRLFDLQRDGAHSTYLRPEISLYLGYNGYQLGNLPMARENLFRFYNLAPQGEEIPLVLTKIGDTYRDEKRFDAASKLYQWVAERHPDSEGALISQIRLAELQEQGRETAQEKGIGFGAQPGETLPSPREVYEAMLEHATFKDRKNPLIALALLKLAVVYEKEGDYGSSLAMIKDLLTRFPGQQLEKETEHVLLKTLHGTVNDSIHSKNFHGAIGFFYEEKDLFQRVDSPELYLAIARAFLEIGLRDAAASLFRKAGSLLLDDEKPSDLLYFLALDLYRQSRPDQALETLKAAVDKGRDSGAAWEAHLLMGRILAERVQKKKALEAFDGALRHSPDVCTRSEILTQKASAEVAWGVGDAALASAKEARRLIAECQSPSLFALENLGDLFFRLGRPEEALIVFTKTTGKEEDEKGQRRIQWKLAQAYEMQGQMEASLSAYQGLADMADPLWSRLANEQIEGIRFQQDMESFKQKETEQRKGRPSL